MATTRLRYQEEKVTKYFVKEKRFLKIAGLSFSGGESLAYKIYSFLLIFWANFMYPFLQFLELFKQDIEVISDMLIYLFGIYVTLAKTIVVLQNRIQFGKIMDRLEKGPFLVNLDRGGVQEEILNKECVWITYAQTKVYWSLCFVTIFCTMIYAVIKRISSSDPKDWEMPFGPLTILNITSSPNYELTLFYQSVSITFIVSHFTTIDLLMAAVLAHITYQFKMLQNNIRCIVVNCYREMQKDKTISGKPLLLENKGCDLDIDGSTIPWKYLHKHLKQTIEYHLEIASLAADMEHVFSKLLLTMFLGTLGILCFSVYRSSVVKDNMKMLIHTGEAFSGSLQVLTVCYWGEQVMFESQQVGNAVLEANFIGTDIRFQKGLAFIIRRSQNPIKLTAGKFVNICLSTFAWIIRTSYSAFMVVRRNG